MSANILVTIPFSEQMDLGGAYNKTMERLPEDGWACLMDHDIMFTTLKWYAQLQDAIKREPQGTFTGVTNRIWSPWQRVDSARQFGDDIAKHRMFGESLLADKRLQDVTDWRPGWGGMLMLISKAAWRDAGGFHSGMECVDHFIHQDLAKAGRRLFCIKGLYVYHFRTSRVRGLGPSARGCCNKSEGL